MIDIRMITTLCLCGLFASCGSEPGDGPDELFPSDVEAQYAEMRTCRHSHEHELRFIRVFASATAEVPYATLSAEAPYPPGSTLVKIEYDDPECEEVLGYTVMRKLTEGENPQGGDWRWQRLDPERVMLEDGAPPRCINCHAQHCAPPHGFDLSCAEEI
jgi:hypothetical protein